MASKLERAGYGAQAHSDETGRLPPAFPRRIGPNAKQYREEVVSPITDYSTVQGLMSQSYIPVFPDTAPRTVSFSAETVEPCLTERTRAILCVYMTCPMCDRDPYSMPPASRAYAHSGDSCPTARTFLENSIRWSTFCEKYKPERCVLAAQIVEEDGEHSQR